MYSCRWQSFPIDKICFNCSRKVPDGWHMEIKLKEVLRREFKSRSLTVNAVSVATKIPSSTLNAWVSAGQLPSAKNLGHLQTLSEYLNIPLSMLLFNKRDKESTESVLFSTTFVDQDKRYRLVIEKI